MKTFIDNIFYSHFEYPCSFCSDIYQTKSDCLQHLKQRHSEMCCKFCPEWFMSIDDLKYHVRYTHADKKNEEVTKLNSNKTIFMTTF